MAVKRKTKQDPHFMPNLEAAIRDEMKKSKRPALPAPAGKPEARAGAKASAESPPPTKKVAKVAKTKPGSSLDRDALLKDLRALLPKLDAEGLDFLLRQATVHLHNMEVERLNAETAAAAAVPKRRKGAADEGKSVLSLERSTSGSSYYVWVDGDSVMFNSDEMLALVRIAHDRDEVVAAARHLGAWLQRERRDALDGLIPHGASKPALVELAGLLRSKFRKPGAGGA